MATITAMAAPPAVGDTDAGLSGRLIAGDETALTEIYDRFAGYVYNLARRVTVSTSLAEDVTQEVFVSLWEKPHAFDPERGTLRAWLGVLTHRRSVDRVRRETTARRYEARRATVVPSPSPADTADAATARLTAERVRRGVPRCPTISAGPSSWPTSTERPTCRWRPPSGSPRAPPSRGCAWR